MGGYWWRCVEKVKRNNSIPFRSKLSAFVLSSRNKRGRKISGIKSILENINNNNNDIFSLENIFMTFVSFSLSLSLFLFLSFSLSFQSPKRHHRTILSALKKKKKSILPDISISIHKPNQTKSNQTIKPNQRKKKTTTYHPSIHSQKRKNLSQYHKSVQHPRGIYI